LQEICHRGSVCLQAIVNSTIYRLAGVHSYLLSAKFHHSCGAHGERPTRDVGLRPLNRILSFLFTLPFFLSSFFDTFPYCIIELS
jgi:hypothetical protein